MVAWYRIGCKRRTPTINCWRNWNTPSKWPAKFSHFGMAGNTYHFTPERNTARLVLFNEGWYAIRLGVKPTFRVYKEIYFDIIIISIVCTLPEHEILFDGNSDLPEILVYQRRCVCVCECVCVCVCALHSQLIFHIVFLSKIEIW